MIQKSKTLGTKPKTINKDLKVVQHASDASVMGMFRNRECKQQKRAGCKSIDFKKDAFK